MGSPPTEWSPDDDVARWEALEAEARTRLDGEAKQAPAAKEAPSPSNAAWDAEEPSWYQDPPAATSPAAPEPSARSTAPTTEPEPDPLPFVPEILLADADLAIGASLEQAMVNRGWIVRRVDNGEMAVAEFVRQSPHVFVFDYTLPGLGGLDLLRRIAELGVGEHTRFVANSTQTQAIHIQRAKAMGANRFLDRPVRGPDQVVEAVAGQIQELAEAGQSTPDAPPPAPPAPSPPVSDQASADAVPGLFADAGAPTGGTRSAPESGARPDNGSSYRSVFGSGGGPPGRIPKLG